MLEMLNAGLFELIVVDDWKARLWAQILPKIKVREDLVLRAEGYAGWAMRKNSPQLLPALDDFYQTSSRSRASRGSPGAVRQAHQADRNNTGTAEWQRFEATVDLFEKYGAQYGFDPLMLAAQGYQESQLDRMRAAMPVRSA